MIIVDWGFSALGFVLIGALYLWWELHKARTPNPYVEPLHRIKFPEYAIWSRQDQPNAPPLFQEGDMVRLHNTRIDVTDHSEPDYTVERSLAHVIEPNDGRETWIPLGYLKRVTNYEASRYEFRFRRKQYLESLRANDPIVAAAAGELVKEAIHEED